MQYKQKAKSHQCIEVYYFSMILRSTLLVFPFCIILYTFTPLLYLRGKYFTFCSQLFNIKLHCMCMEGFYTHNCSFIQLLQLILFWYSINTFLYVKYFNTGFAILKSAKTFFLVLTFYLSWYGKLVIKHILPTVMEKLYHSSGVIFWVTWLTKVQYSHSF